MEKYKKKEGLFALLPVIILVLTVFFAGSPVKAEEKTHTIWFFFENVCASCHEEDDFYDLFNRCVTARRKLPFSMRSVLIMYSKVRMKRCLKRL